MDSETTATIVLAAWERAYGLGPVERGLALLSLAKPHEALSELTQLPIGRRDAELLRLRQRFFGNEIHSLDTCPECGEKLEVSFTVTDVLIPQQQSQEGSHTSHELTRLKVDDADLTLRAVTTADLLSVQRLASPRARRDMLLRRCVSIGGHFDELQAPSETSNLSVSQIRLTDSGLQTVNEKLTEMDPQADIRIAMDCTRCSHHWSSRFDIVSFLWAEIDAWAQRLLAEVHSLAFAYGWSEHDILTMSSWRRHLYLGMLRR